MKDIKFWVSAIVVGLISIFLGLGILCAGIVYEVFE